MEVQVLVRIEAGKKQREKGAFSPMGPLRFPLSHRTQKVQDLDSDIRIFGMGMPRDLKTKPKPLNMPRSRTLTHSSSVFLIICIENLDW